ncbi:MAG: RNA polymerase sigma factor [Ferruginibacter sp.]
MQSGHHVSGGFFYFNIFQPFVIALRHYIKYISFKNLPVEKNNIIEGCKNGDRRCQELLYRQYYSAMLKVCYRYTNSPSDASMIYNQAMFKALDNIRQFKQEGDIGAWIRRIVVNSCIDFCRTKIKFIMHPVSINEEPELPVDPDIYHKFSAEAAMQMLKKLPGNTALVFNLFAIEGYKHEEIATMLDIAVGTSKWQLSEARRLLRLQLLNNADHKIYSNVI